MGQVVCCVKEGGTPIEDENVENGAGDATQGFPKDKAVKVRIIGAENVSSSEAEPAPGQAASEPYCVCEILGKPASRVRTPAVVGGPDPTWDWEGLMPTFEAGDTLIFTLFDQATARHDEHIGRAQLPSRRLGGGAFDGELNLAGGGAGGTLRVIVTPIPRPKSKGKRKKKAPETAPEKSAADAPKEEEAKPVSMYRLHISKKKHQALGANLSTLDGLTLTVVDIGEGPLQDHNQSAPLDKQVRAGDILTEVNGQSGQKKMIKQLGHSQELDLTFHRVTSLFTVEINKLEWERLGLSFAFELGAKSIVVADVTVGPVSEWNQRNPDWAVTARDRIVAVNGESGLASELMDRINRTEEHLRLSFWRPPVGPSLADLVEDLNTEDDLGKEDTTDDIGADDKGADKNCLEASAAPVAGDDACAGDVRRAKSAPPSLTTASEAGGNGHG